MKEKRPVLSPEAGDRKEKENTHKNSEKEQFLVAVGLLLTSEPVVRGRQSVIRLSCSSPLLSPWRSNTARAVRRLWKLLLLIRTIATLPPVGTRSLGVKFPGTFTDGGGCRESDERVGKRGLQRYHPWRQAV
ncbi:hypothetical protein BaRGS_00002945 [Batillaria attramentaria]|uniref:Uncharacterized protein n=1 Tax=Batillaria attramentaria TaxID=370345 RepID=A0ABD0M2Z6_9CAEN